MVISVKKRLFLKFSIGITAIGLLASAFVLLPAQHTAAVTCTQFVTNTNDSGAGSLRQAIINANAAGDADVICFSIGSGRVQIIPTSPMPVIVNPVVIDGSTQPGFSGAPLIELSGNGAGAGAIGLRITGNGSTSTIRGLIINRFSGNGIFLDSGNNTIVGNYIGTTADGMSGAGNKGDGIGIFSGTSAVNASSNTIGGTTVADKNIISGSGQTNPNGANGIGITAQNGGAANNNLIIGNLIGMNANGTGAIANNGDGVLINDAGGGTLTGNIIGGTTGVTPGGACSGACNLISGNWANGIGFWHAGAYGNSALGNYVGTDVYGTGRVGNGNIGIEVNSTPNNTIGGTTAAARNVLSGNYGAGLFLTGAPATGNVVAGNFIGTNAAGTGVIGNAKMGVGVGASPNAVGANSNIIGGTTGTTPGSGCSGSCNLISGNSQNGIFISGTESFGQQIFGNYIGLNASGTVAIGNVGDGIGLLNTPNTAIGNGTTAARNFIASNGSNGIIIAGNASTGDRIDGNTIGLAGFGNTASGVAVSSATDIAIVRNSIFGNGILGIDLDNNGSPNLNTPGGPHAGANRLQNQPDVLAARNLGINTRIGGQFNSTPNTSFTIDFFYSSGCNAGPPRNYGQGQNYIGSITVGTDQFGNTAFGYTTSAIPGNTYVTATASRNVNGIPDETSEFSKCIVVNAAKPALTNGANWFLKDYLISGPGDRVFGYGFPAYLLMCAWDPNQPGVKLPVVFSGGRWLMRASYTTGVADLTFSYGASNARPVCGDWNGDGVETVGAVTPDSIWSLRNTNSSGPPDIGPFQYGPFNSTPVVGDWNGDGTTTIGMVDGSNNWSLRNTNGSGPADYGFHYGIGTPVVGDWNGDGITTIGVVSSGGHWALRNSLSDGPSTVDFNYGFPGTVPLIW